METPSSSNLSRKDEDAKCSNLSNISSCGKNEEIRSFAIVKKSQFEFPVSFRELQFNTDLKTPPSNWLRGGKFSVCLPNSTLKKSDFSSFIMGYQFPDCIGEVDIVSDAENIKKLLKMAYKQDTHLSMMVHRIGKTLLIDEFDIYSYLLMQSENQWKWLRKFFYHHILQDFSLRENNVIVRPNKSRDMVQSKNLLSKFLYYSIGEEENIPLPSSSSSEIKDKNNSRPMTLFSPTRDQSLRLLVEEESLPEPPSQPPFTRNVIWKFEDLCMLIGTNLPIFGGRTHPCVSLRLRDMDKPINILTGIDYWLDNLMCNVPEVVMCYHQDGIVQKYELVKTEDLPQMKGSEFSPQLVTDIAHNILSFLKSKATKEGHTYWLFKAKDDDIVKLYDLTSLADDEEVIESFNTSNEVGGSSTEESDSQRENHLNPFTIPVAMLLYHVAKNIWYSNEASGSNAPELYFTVCNLLEHSISLLSKEKREKYIKICVHSHLILSDVYLPQNFDADSPHLSDDIRQKNIELTKKSSSLASSFSVDQTFPSNLASSESGTIFSASYSSLCKKRGKRNKHRVTESPPKLSRNLCERCGEAVKHVISGISHLLTLKTELNSSLNLHEEKSEEILKTKRSESREEDEQTYAKPFVPIPMPYEPLSAAQLSPERDKEAKCPQEPTYHKEFDSSSPRNRSSEPKNSQSSVVKRPILTQAMIQSQLRGASFAHKMTFQLLRKASLIYMTKARIELNDEKYGLCLRYVRLSLRCWCCLLYVLGSHTEFSLPVLPLILAGDSYYNLSKNWSSSPVHIEDFNTLSEETLKMNDILDLIGVEIDFSSVIKVPCDPAEAMNLSYKVFEMATQNSGQPDVDLQRRLASICNELGCILMNQADQICSELGAENVCGDLWKQSWDFLEKATTIFRGVEDNDNIALLHCNKGRYLRIYAFHHSPTKDVAAISHLVREKYEKAFVEYEIALGILNPKENLANVTDSIQWEYSTALFGYTAILQDVFGCGSEMDSESFKYLSSLYNKCLKYCDTESPTRGPLYQYRVGIVHSRLAVLYHGKYKRSKDSKIMHLSEMHFRKSESHFLSLDASASDILRVHLDHVNLLEDAMQDTKSHLIRWKYLVSILDLLSNCENVFGLTKKDAWTSETSCESQCEDEVAQESQTVNVFEKKLTSSLLEFLKMSRMGNKSTKRFEGIVKEMYMLSLNKEKKNVIHHLSEALAAIKPKIKSIAKEFLSH